jgi:hypothetical protein
MKPELDKALCEKYPKIFVNRHADMSTTAMCWGLEVGDGWYNLIDTLCEALTYTYTTSIKVDEEDGKHFGIKPYADSYYFTVEPPQVIADQVKEKFGGLRFYYHLEYNERNNYLLETEKYPDLQQIVDRYSDYINGIIHFAEIASGRTCEETGQPGELHVTGGSRKGWLKTVSKEYAKTVLTDRNYIPWSEIPKNEETA